MLVGRVADKATEVGSSGILKEPKTKSLYLFLCTNVSPFRTCFFLFLGFPGDTGVKNTPANAGDTRDMGSIPGLGRSPCIGNG